MPSGALDGVRVVDMTAVGMGPLATQRLGDMGADVIKIEPAAGDVFRHVTPQRHAGMSHAYLNLNRNKRSVVLDAKTTHGKAAILRLVEGADVFVTNLRPQSIERLGLHFDALRERNPRLVYCACYGYSEAGPYAGRAGVDDTIQAACGLAWLQGVGADAPRYMNTLVVDKIMGLEVAHAIVLALYARERTGKGQAIEVPMFESMVAFVLPEHLAGRTFEPPEGEAGYARLLNPFRKPFATADGYLGVVPYTDAQWAKFFAIVGRPEMARDPRYATLPRRSEHIRALYEFVASSLAERPTAAWVAALADADIPFAPVNSIDDLITDPHLAAVGFWQKVEHPSEGTLRMPGIPTRFSGTPGSIRRHAPAIGEHTEEILREIGMEKR